MEPENRYSITTKITYNPNLPFRGEGKYFIVKATITYQSMFFEAHGEHGNLEEAENMAIARAMEYANIPNKFKV